MEKLWLSRLTVPRLIISTITNSPSVIIAKKETTTTTHPNIPNMLCQMSPYLPKRRQPRRPIKIFQTFQIFCVKYSPYLPKRRPPRRPIPNRHLEETEAQLLPLCRPVVKHTSYLSFFLHTQNFWRIKFTPKFTQ